MDYDEILDTVAGEISNYAEQVLQELIDNGYRCCSFDVESESFFDRLQHCSFEEYLKKYVGEDLPRQELIAAYVEKSNRETKKDLYTEWEFEETKESARELFDQIGWGLGTRADINEIEVFFHLYYELIIFCIDSKDFLASLDRFKGGRECALAAFEARCNEIRGLASEVYDKTEPFYISKGEFTRYISDLLVDCYAIEDIKLGARDLYEWVEDMMKYYILDHFDAIDRQVANGEMSREEAWGSLDRGLIFGFLED